MNIAKRALKLDNVKKDIRYDATPLKTKVKDLNTYSPTTGTREMSPFSSPMSHDEQNLKNHLSNANLLGNRTEQKDSASRLPRRGQPQTEEDVFMELQCTVESSLDRILEIRANLTSLQALEGSRELENVGLSTSSCNLRDEVQKTRELLSQAKELQLLKRDHGKLLAQRKKCHCAFSGLVNWLSRHILSELNEFTEPAVLVVFVGQASYLIYQEVKELMDRFLSDLKQMWVCRIIPTPCILKYNLIGEVPGPEGAFRPLVAPHS